MNTILTFNKVFFLCAVLAFSSLTTAHSEMENPAALLQPIMATLDANHKSLRLGTTVKDLSQESAFTDEELLKLCNETLTKISLTDAAIDTAEEEQLKIFTASLIRQLKDRNVTGFGFSSHFSTALGYGKSSFDFNISFKNKDGSFQKPRNFKISYTSIGWNLHFTRRFDFIFITGKDSNLYDLRNGLILDQGIDFGIRIPSTGPIFNLGDNANQLGMTTFPLITTGITVIPFREKVPEVILEPAEGVEYSSDPINGNIVILHFGIGPNGLPPFAATSERSDDDRFLTSVAKWNPLKIASSFNLSMIRAGGFFGPSHATVPLLNKKGQIIAPPIPVITAS